MRHTPGPWVIDAPVTPHPEMVGIFSDGEFGPETELALVHATLPRDTANATLIAAAPELLAACKGALPLLIEAGQLIPDGVYFDNGPVIARLEAAIAKAEGG